jgi:hypothetical protein
MHIPRFAKNDKTVEKSDQKSVYFSIFRENTSYATHFGELKPHRGRQTCWL